MSLSTGQPPISFTRLKQIANDACASALGKEGSYDHSRTESWNTTIINTMLRALISESSPQGGHPGYKYAVNSTIIQHLVPTSQLPKSHGNTASTSTSTEPSEGTVTTSDVKSEATSTDGKPHVGRRGMHSATGAYWNEKTDGMWSYKYEGGEGKGLDVVIMVIWIGI